MIKNYERSGMGVNSMGSPVQQSKNKTKISLSSANKIEDSTYSFGAGSNATNSINLSTNQDLFSTKGNKNRGKFKNTTLSATGDAEFNKTANTQSTLFEGSKKFIQGFGSDLFTSSEQNALNSDLKTNANTSKLTAGLNLSSSTEGRGSKTTFGVGGGGSLSTTGSHLKGTDAGVNSVSRDYDATISYDGQQSNAYSNTFSRGDDELFYGNTASNVGNWHGGVGGTTSSGQFVNFGGQGLATQDFFDKVDKYEISKNTTKENISTFEKKDKKTEFKPFVNFNASHQWGLNNPWTGTIKGGWGSKHSANSGFSGSIGVKSGKYSKMPGFEFGVSGSKKGFGVNASYEFGNKKK